jgi:lipocalin
MSNANADLGVSVSLSRDGDIAIVGGPADDSAGAAWVFMRSGGVWSQQAKLVGTSGSFAGQGASVSVSGDGNTAIVGGPGGDAAWVFAQPVFAGTPGKANCHGQSVSALARQYGGLNNAAADLGFSDVSALQNAILGFCGG